MNSKQQQLEGEFNARLDLIMKELCDTPSRSRYSVRDIADLEADYERRKRDPKSMSWIGDPRGPRRVKAFTKIVGYWAERAEFEDVDLVNPQCFRCRVGFSKWESFERAHLVDRARGGLDLESNIVPLCHLCHALMPSFGAEDGQAAIAWVKRS